MNEYILFKNNVSDKLIDILFFCIVLTDHLFIYLIIHFKQNRTFVLKTLCDFLSDSLFCLRLTNHADRQWLKYIVVGSSIVTAIYYGFGFGQKSTEGKSKFSITTKVQKCSNIYLNMA